MHRLWFGLRPGDRLALRKSSLLHRRDSLSLAYQRALVDCSSWMACAWGEYRGGRSDIECGLDSDGGIACCGREGAMVGVGYPAGDEEGCVMGGASRGEGWARRGRPRAPACWGRARPAAISPGGC